MHSRFRYLVLSLVVIGACTCVQARDIAVVKTRSLPTIDRLISGFQSVCNVEHKVSIYDMKGSSKQGKKILSKIQQAGVSADPQAIFALGLPAVKLMDHSSINARLFFAMINDPYGKSGVSRNTPGFAQNLSARLLLEQVKLTLPGVEKIAIIHSKEVANDKIENFVSVANHLSLDLTAYFIRSMKDLPDSLLEVIRENDVLLLIPDRNVTNRHSIEFLVTTAITRAFPIIGYNEHLVKAGLMASISPDYSALGKVAAEVVCNDRSLNNKQYQPQKAAISVNIQALKIIKPELLQRLQETADYVY